MKSFEDFKSFIFKYKGAIIGAIIAIIFICTGLFELCLALAVIAGGILAGDYIQNNKELVKEKLKKFIDRF